MTERRFQRVPFQAEMRVFANNSSWDCSLLNIALKGALLECRNPLPIELNTACVIKMSLPGSGIELDFRAELVHREEAQYGFKFLSVDLTTLTHLRKLIELNTGDADCVRDELMAWLEEG
ncbi:MAG: PilZ domain-containing protein [Desulfuromonadales bacterium]|jgi:hypothetical protein|nr:PilZ domain-containing protein [Desulfuromonadales bacterium]